MIHKNDISENDIKSINGFKVTTVLKTLLDLIEERRISDELIEQATKDIDLALKEIFEFLMTNVSDP